MRSSLFSDYYLMQWREMHFSSLIFVFAFKRGTYCCVFLYERKLQWNDLRIVQHYLRYLLDRF
jgi:hypothetical protein